MFMLFFLVVAGIMAGLQWLAAVMLNQFGLKRFSHYQLALKAVFYLVWIGYNIAGILLITTVKDNDGLLCRHCLLNENPALNYTILFTFFPFAATLFKLIKENPGNTERRNVLNVLSLFSLVACYALFIGAFFNLLIGNSSLKPGG